MGYRYQIGYKIMLIHEHFAKTRKCMIKLFLILYLRLNITHYWLNDIGILLQQTVILNQAGGNKIKVVHSVS